MNTTEDAAAASDATTGDVPAENPAKLPPYRRAVADPRYPPSLHGDAGGRDRDVVAGPLGAGGHVQRAQPHRRAVRGVRPGGDPLARLRPGHVPVPVGRRACTSATRWATSAPTSTPATCACAARTSCTPWASTRSGCRPSSTRCRPGSIPRPPPTPTSMCSTPSCAGWAWATTCAAPWPRRTPSSTAGRSGSSCRSSTPGTTSTWTGPVRSRSWSPSCRPGHGNRPWPRTRSAGPGPT